MTTLELTGYRLSVADVVSVARGSRRVALAADARHTMQRSVEAARELVRAGTPIYGFTTGAGPLDQHTVELPTDAAGERLGF